MMNREVDELQAQITDLFDRRGRLIKRQIQISVRLDQPLPREERRTLIQEIQDITVETTELSGRIGELRDAIARALGVPDTPQAEASVCYTEDSYFGPWWVFGEVDAQSGARVLCVWHEDCDDTWFADIKLASDALASDDWGFIHREIGGEDRGVIRAAVQRWIDDR